MLLPQKLKVATMILGATGFACCRCRGLLCPAAAEEQPSPPGAEAARAEGGRKPVVGREDRADGQIKVAEALPREAVRRLGTVRFRHPGIVSTPRALAANGKVLATGGHGGVVCSPPPWDAQTGEPTWPPRPAALRATPPCSRRCGRNPSPSPRMGSWFLNRVTTESSTSGKARPVAAAVVDGASRHGSCRPVFSRRGHDCLGQRRPDRPSLVSRDWQGACRFEGQRKHNNAWTVAFTPDGKTRPRWRHWGTLSVRRHHGSDLHRCRGHRSVVGSVGFSPDGKTLVSGGHDGTVRGWASATGRPLWQFAVRGEVWTVAFSADGRSLAALTRERFVHVWDMTTVRETNRFKVEWTMQGSLLFAPDGKTLIAGDGCSISRWDVAKGKQLRPAREHRGVVMSLAFAPDGKTLASGFSDGNGPSVDSATGRSDRAAHGSSGPGSRGELRSSRTSPGSASSDGVILLSDPSTSRTLRQLPGYAGSMLALSFTPDGKSLVSQGRDGLVHSWEVATGRDGGPWRGQQDFVFGLALSPDGTLLASAGRVPRHIANRSNDLSITLWSTPTRREIRHLVVPDGLSAVVFSPRGNVLASRGWDGTVRVWETATGGEPLAGSPRSVAIIPGHRFFPRRTVARHGLSGWHSPLHGPGCRQTLRAGPRTTR